MESSRTWFVSVTPTEVLDALHTAVVVLDDRGVVEYANPEAASTLDALRTGTVFHDLVHPIESPSAVCPLRSAIARRAVTVDQADVFARADGALTPVRWSVDRLGIDRTVLTVADATSRRRREVDDAASRDRDRAELWAAQQSVSDLGWIAELTRTMSSTMDEREALLRLARLVTPRLADVAIVDVVGDDGELTRVGGAVAPDVALDLDAVFARPDVQHEHGTAGRPTREVAASSVVVRLDAAQMADPGVVSEASRTLLREIGARTMLVVPLAARNRTNAVVGLVRLTDDAYTEDDLLLAADIGRRAGLALDNARLYREQARVAESLQRALLPAVRDTGRLQVAARYLPAADLLRVGGDWYDLFDCPDESDAHGFVVGDVAGHDLAAATTMAALRNLLRAIAVTAGGGPAGVLTAVDTALPSLDIDGTATCVVVRVQPRDDTTWTVAWSNAGHLPPVLVEPDGRARLLEARPGLLLGTGIPTTRQDDLVDVPAGSIVLVYSDGLVERRGEHLDVGLAQLVEAASVPEVSTLSVEEFLAVVLDRVSPSGENDTAVLAVRLT